MEKEQVQFELVEVTISNAGITQFNLATNQVLEQAKEILAIEAYKVGDASISPISGSNVVNDTVFEKAYLSLVSKTQTGKTIIDLMPLVDLNRPSNQGVMQAFTIKDQLNVTKCFITTASAASQSTSEVFLLGFHYIDGNS